MTFRNQMSVAAIFTVMMVGAVAGQRAPQAAGPAAAMTLDSDSRPSASHPGEEEVDAYTVSNANAGASPVTDPAVSAAFHARDGVSRIVDDLLEQVQKDRRTQEVFYAADFVRLRRTLKEQVCSSSMAAATTPAAT